MRDGGWIRDHLPADGSAVLREVTGEDFPDQDASAWVTWYEANREGYRMVRGGNWTGRPDMARAATRLTAFPDQRFGTIGFRLCRSWPG